MNVTHLKFLSSRKNARSDKMRIVVPLIAAFVLVPFSGNAICSSDESAHPSERADGALAASQASPSPSLSDMDARRITLADALALALKNNPHLAAFSWDIRAAEAREIQARLRPNPELLVEIEDVRLGTGAGARTRHGAVGFSSSGWTYQSERSSENGARSGFSEAQFTVSLSQLIELGGKRSKRMQAAARDRDVSAWDYEVARADVLKDATQAFVEVIAAQERVTLDDELVQLAERVLDAVSARVNAGRVSPLEATRAKTALSAAQIQANASQRNLEAARVTLAALWGDTVARFDRAEGSLEDNVRPIPVLDEIRERIATNPDLSRWRAEVEKRKSAIVLEKAKAIPDVIVSAGFRTRGMPDRESRSYGFGSDGLTYSQGKSDSDSARDNSVVLGVSVPLPLFHRNQGSILEAEHLLSKAGEQRRATDVDVNARLRKAYEGASAAYATLSSLKDDILPAATSTFAAINEAYTQGKFGYLDVLDAQRTLFEARQQCLDALASYHENIAEIERTIGESLWNADLGAPRPEEEK
ncbi:MAG TPA: TolC family protein [Candidatus Hydrogenedentes bacterium]|nr:TolC family protein [Candidatus Hydrogenedentota bacterium]